MELRIEIETFDKQVEFDLLEAENTISQGMERPIAEGITLRYEGTLFRKGVGFPDIIQIVIDVAEAMTIGIASGLISAWLYDKLKGRSVEKMRIERTEVILDKGEVQKNSHRKDEEREILVSAWLEKKLMEWMIAR